MAKKLSKKSLTWIIIIVVVVAAVFIGLRIWKARQYALPKGIVSGNGRLEAKLADVAAREPLRIKEVLVDEGDLVKTGQVVVELDPVTLHAQLIEANAGVLTAEKRLSIVKATITRKKSEINLAKIEVERSRKLVAENAGSQREYDARKTALETTTAALAEAEADLATAAQEVEVAKANVATIQTRIDDATLRSPVNGRVLYRLAEAGEVLAPGGKALTLVNLEDVYMEIFLPSKEAARIKMGAEGRITVDYAPGRAVAGYVSFVSPEAQFTPKQVETKSERDKLMFRVKIQLPKELASAFIEHIKTGVRGVGYVKLDPNAVWPSWLQDLIVPPAKPDSTQTAPPADSASGAAAK
jgi:HlyD family secretion protein